MNNTINRNDFLNLCETARSLGVKPDVLRYAVRCHYVEPPQIKLKGARQYFSPEQRRQLADYFDGRRQRLAM